MKKEKKPKQVEPTFSKEFVDQVVKVMGFGLDPITACRAVGGDPELWFNRMKEASLDKKHPDRQTYDVISQKDAQFEGKLTHRWLEGKEGWQQAADFLKSTRSRFNKRTQMELEHNLRKACELINEICCEKCKQSLVGAIAGLGRVDDPNDERLLPE